MVVVQTGHRFEPDLRVLVQPANDHLRGFSGSQHHDWYTPPAFAGKHVAHRRAAERNQGSST